MRKVPQTKTGKTEEGIFIGPKIWYIINDEHFDKLLQGDEKAAWDIFKFVVKVFLGNRRAQNYEELVNNRFQSYQKWGCNMSLKIHFLHPHLVFSPGELWCIEWWTWRTFPSRHFFNGDEIPREMEMCYSRRLLLDFGKGCFYRGIQATGKRGGGLRDFGCVK